MAYKKSILMLIVLLYAVGMVTAIRYYRFMKEDPAYCSMCHIMEEGYNSWEKSRHYLIICQDCHGLTVVEGNKLLISRYIKGGSGIEQAHGRQRPWEKCVECHVTDVAQGAVTLRESYGHARHVFMRNLTCGQCHSGRMHGFGVEHTKCQKCHTDKLVHGMGTKGTYCLNCHTFKEKSPELVPEKRCFICHHDIPTTGVMSQIKCYDCHHPHAKLKLESEDCLGACHGNETRVGQHGLHINQLSLECLDCHSPHRWVVGEKEAKGLCDKCHPLKDPRTFIY
jgi:hypothetical protein